LHPHFLESDTLIMTQTLEITLDALAATGEAGAINPQSGKRLLVADAIPGERVEVEIVEDQPEWQRGRLLRVLDASPDRVTPPCPYFGPPQPVSLPDGTQLNPQALPRCAGCLWQHIAYDRQLELKRQIVVDHLTRTPVVAGDLKKRRAGAEAVVQDVIALGDLRSSEDVALDYNFLTGMTFGLDATGALCLPTRPLDERTSPLLPIEFCPLHHRQLADLFAAFVVDEETGAELARDLVSIEMTVGATADEISDGHKGVIVLESRHGPTADGRLAPELELDLPVNILLRRGGGEGADAVELLVGDWSYQAALGADRFTAYPPMGGAPLVSLHVSGDEAIGTIALSVLEVQPFEHLVHLWAGAGLISSIIAQQAATLIAIEDTDLAIAALEANTAGADNVDIHSGAVRRVLDNLRRGRYETNLALLTPRDDDDDVVDDVIFRHLNRLGVTRLAVVVDNGAELARLIPIARGERYELTSVQPVDLQPQQEIATLIARFDRIR
jgi:23S rRNA (uracil1939-C5)-methyltransferase